MTAIDARNELVELYLNATDAMPSITVQVNSGGSGVDLSGVGTWVFEVFDPAGSWATVTGSVDTTGAAAGTLVLGGITAAEAATIGAPARWRLYDDTNDLTYLAGPCSVTSKGGGVRNPGGLSATITQLSTTVTITAATAVTGGGGSGVTVTTGVGAPSSTPAAEGDIYVDTTNDNVWMATGTASSADWKQATGAGGGDLLAANNLSDVANAATARTNLGVAIGTDVQAHSAVLDATTASFTTADETKLDGIEAGATADQSASEILAAIATVDGAGSGLDADLLDGQEAAAFAAAGHDHTGTYQPLDADLTAIAAGNNGSVLAATTASFTTADETKLDGIEAGADVTDTANVTAAGALMDSEVDADIKTLSLPANTTISTFGASLVDDPDAATARATLDVDQAGTDNSTDVTLAGTPDYLTIAGQVITRNPIDLTADVTGDLPVSEGGTGSGTAAGARTNLGVAIGTDVQAFGSVSVVTESTTSKTLALTDLGDAVRCTNASATTVTVPPNSSVAFAVGSTVLIRAVGAGGVTVAAGAGVTVNGNKSIAQGEGIIVHKIATDEWDAYGGTSA